MVPHNERSIHMNFSRFDTKEVIGKGISGNAQLCKSKAGVYVIKTYHEKERYETKLEYHHRVLHEYRVLEQLHHCNIVRVYKYDVSLMGGTVRMFMEAGGCRVMEQLPKVLLQEMIQSNKVDEADALRTQIRCLFKQICSGVEYLHSSGISHRDLKLDNLVVGASGIVKIIDFATAFRSGSENTPAIGIVGSAAYCAPETFSSLEYDGKAADIWSLGIVLCMLVFKKPPWKSAHATDPLYTQFVADPGPLHTLLAVCIDSTTITSQMLVPSVGQRLAISDFFRDPWFDSIEQCCDSYRCAYHLGLTPVVATDLTRSTVTRGD